MRAACVAVVVIVAAGAARADTSQQRFAAGTALEAEGRYREAADALERLGHERPDDSFAADALYEAAVVSEERLADPARAERLYAEVATRYPSNRLARRARTRADFLQRSLSTGEAPLREYDDILAGATRRPRAESRARMEALLARHPDFALADRALFWLGQRYAEARDWKAAEARFAAVEQRFPSSEWASRAKKARADLILAAGHPFAARVLYRELAASSDPLARSAGDEGLAAAATWVRRAVLVVAASLYLFLFAALLVRGIRPRRRLVRPPLEVLYYAPVAALFVAAAATENRAIGLATFGIALGGAALVWLSSAASIARLERGPLPMRGRVLRALAVLLAVGALVYLSLQATGLTDIVIETFRSGPERA